MILVSIYLVVANIFTELLSATSWSCLGLNLCHLGTNSVQRIDSALWQIENLSLFLSILFLINAINVLKLSSLVYLRSSLRWNWRAGSANSFRLWNNSSTTIRTSKFSPRRDHSDGAGDFGFYQSWRFLRRLRLSRDALRATWWACWMGKVNFSCTIFLGDNNEESRI